MTEIKRTKEVIYETVYQAYDGVIFGSKDECLTYESGKNEVSKEIDKMRVFKDFAPCYFDDFGCCYEWYKVKNKEDIELLKERLDNDDEVEIDTISHFPEYVCVRVNDCGDYYAHTTLTRVISGFKNFMEGFGYKTIIIKEHEEIK